MAKNIDLATVLAIAKAMTPAPVAPVAPIVPLSPSEYTKGSESAIAMAKDIEYLRKAVDDIGKQLKEITEKHVTITDFTEHVMDNSKAHDDFEKRMREISTQQTRILTIGSGLIILMTVIQVWLKISGH